MKLGIRAKITIPITIAVLAAFAATSITLLTQFNASLTDSINNTEQEIIFENTYKIQGYMVQYEEAASVLSSMYEDLILNGMTREKVVSAMENQALSNTSFAAVWMAFEPDAFDSNDSVYAGKEETGSTDTGRFTPCVVLDGGSAAVSSMQVDGEEFYEVARQSKKLYVTKPLQYDYGTMVDIVVSVCMPIIVDNQTLGVCGLDISLSAISKDITSYKLYETGHVRLMDSDGEYIAHENAAEIGAVNASAAVKAAAGQSGVVKEEIDGISYSYAQVPLLKSGVVWIVELAIPMNEAMKPVNDAILTAVIVISVAVLLILGIVIWLGNNINNTVVKPVAVLSEAAQRMSLGDLDIHMEAKGDSEIAQLTRAFQRMIDDTRTQAELLGSVADGHLDIEVHARSDKDILGSSLEHMVDRLNMMFSNMNNSAHQLSVSSSQIAEGSQSLAQGATEQASTVERLHVTLNDISDKTVKNAEQANHAATLSESVKTLAEKGNHQMEQMMDAVDQISKASEAISKVIKVIDDIAFQTNILALNAAVEAARAGQHGKGFAVVAEEVRNLAAKSANAAKDTGSLIANSIEKARLGAKISADTAVSFAEIVDGVNKSSAIVMEISDFMQTQKTEIESITRGVDSIGTVVNSISSAAEQSASSSQEMSGQSAAMASELSQYKLRDGGMPALGSGR